MFDRTLLAKKIKDLEPYKVDNGRYDIRLDANESFADMPSEMKDKFAEIVRSVPFSRYPDPNASDLCSAFASVYGISSENIAAGSGSDEIISIIMNCFLDKGERVMTFTPDFSMYEFYAELAELETVKCPKAPDTLQIDFEKADKAIKDSGAKLVIFSNPCNPTGRIEKKSDIEALAEKNPNTIFAVDEAYMDFAEKLSEKESFLNNICSYSNVFVLKTMSKALGAAALRLGFIVGAKELIDTFKAVKSPYNVNSVSQAIGEAVLKEKTMLQTCTKAIVNQKNRLYGELSEMFPTADTFTNFVFIRTPLAEKIYLALKEKGILTRFFKIGEGALRITAGNEEENTVLVREIKKIKEALDYEKR